ncbi:hypothetical protein [Moraxella bovis]|uniref:Uncharacterized protein conserved in bacteria n=1 Tax=Moraxella bovis TaxID=476 RepID=A0A378PPS8_MORBO|nr:hypothetical protein [Moraxella bovis]UYZ68398.1 hypothetical protein LP122_11750 [Moraxella bovis]UYZ70771.1 hypothetical protein LP089_11845 [Moraxella bovis]UYZ73297.1 hypothetical protein LP105_00775 [Moraxella bovis]UYZ75619.1 hypothetical protein LP093_12970 [Moraxella bovis]UYZ78439.1 hypothetical protein LP115_00830 [Moraxella bovis]
MPIQMLRGGVAVLSLTALSVAVSAHAMLPTPTETTESVPNQASAGEISYTANPQANRNAPTLNTPTAGRVVTVAPQSTPIYNPLGQNPAPAVIPMAVSPLQAPAQTQAPQRQGSSAGIQSVVNAFIVQNINGQETLTPINAGTPVKSGDILEYQGLFTNNSSERVRSMDVTLSIADGLALVGGIHPRFPHATIDGSRFVRSPIRANVGGQVQELPLSDYKALRWTLEDIGLGGTSVVKYRAKVK